MRKLVDPFWTLPPALGLRNLSVLIHAIVAGGTPQDLDLLCFLPNALAAIMNGPHGRFGFAGFRSEDTVVLRAMRLPTNGDDPAPTGFDE